MKNQIPESTVKTAIQKRAVQYLLGLNTKLSFENALC